MTLITANTNQIQFVLPDLLIIRIFKTKLCAVSTDYYSSVLTTLGVDTFQPAFLGMGPEIYST